MHLRTLYSPGQTQRPPHVARVNSRVQAVRCIVGQLDRVLVILGDVKGDRGSEQGGKELKRERRQGWDSGLECNQNEGTRFHRLYRER